MTDWREGLRDEEILDYLKQRVTDLYWFRDFFFEQKPRPPASDRQRLIKKKREHLLELFHQVDENELFGDDRVNYLFLKGRTYNVVSEYDPRATQALSKAVKLNPHFVNAWNELGECYWKNFNTKEAKSSFEGALKTARSKVTLRSLSIILRQETTNDLTLDPTERKKIIEQTVDLAKEAVGLDIKDGVSWCVLGNAYLCVFFVVTQDPAILKLSMSAYKQAELDPIARGQPDLYYNKGVAHKYCEQYADALDCFRTSIELDPGWEPPTEEQRRLAIYLTTVTDLIHHKGKIKNKKLQQMAQSIDRKMLGEYADPDYLFTSRKLKLTFCYLDDLKPGANWNSVVLGKVVGSIHIDSVVPFTFAMMDEKQTCVGVTVYNWADGRGVIIGDTVAIPAPLLNTHTVHDKRGDFFYKSVRVDNPVMLMVNGKRISQNQLAGTRITCKYQLQ